MFVWNIKINIKFLVKVLFVIIFIVLAAIFIFSASKIFGSGLGKEQVSDKINLPNISNIDSSNYTNVLKAVHDNIDQYIGQKISFTGYVYRVTDIKDNEFIVARDMILDSENKSVVVGFLCTTKDYDKLKDDMWVSVTGVLKKGSYHGDIPIVEIESFQEVQKPSDDIVYPPDEAYIPTSVLL